MNFLLRTIGHATAQNGHLAMRIMQDLIRRRGEQIAGKDCNIRQLPGDQPPFSFSAFCEKALYSV